MPKRNRACIHCQKAHLVCNDTRPCSRCIKRNLQDTCRDGIRKKAKYLRSDEAPLPTAFTTPLPTPSPTTVLNQKLPPLAPPVPSLVARPPPPTSIAGTQTVSREVPTALLTQPPNVDFGSDHMNSEYAYLSNMLLDPIFADLGTSATHYDLPELGSLAGSPTYPPAPPQPSLTPTASLLNPVIPPITANGSTLLPSTSMNSLSQSFNPLQRTNEVYASVIRPYNYREGYRYLLKYVKERMKKPDMIRIVRAMSRFRPPFLAQTMSLSEEDLIFMEKCFQRNLLECEKLVAASGTPTVILRRTGDVAFVGKEFLLLTQWTKEQLLSKKTYIYELMDSKSAVDYWEKFTLIAFDNSQQSIMSTCTLLTPTGRHVPCAFCLTIKKDPFDLPLVVIGNFLPLF